MFRRCVIAFIARNVKVADLNIVPVFFFEAAVSLIDMSVGRWFQVKIGKAGIGWTEDEFFMASGWKIDNFIFLFMFIVLIDFGDVFEGGVDVET